VAWVPCRIDSRVPELEEEPVAAHTTTTLFGAGVMFSSPSFSGESAVSLLYVFNLEGGSSGEVTLLN
jgi:hypothetical protein